LEAFTRRWYDTYIRGFPSAAVAAMKPGAKASTWLKMSPFITPTESA
jgi:hypothetical protein